MSGFNMRLSRYVVMVAILVLSIGIGSAEAVEDTFSVDIDSRGDVVAGQGTGSGDGAWYYYPYTDWWNQWFYNGQYDLTRKKVIEVDLTFRVLDPAASVASSVEVTLNWTTNQWRSDPEAPAPPLPPEIRSEDHERQLIQRHILIPRRDIRESIFIFNSYEIEDYCPEWVSIDVRGVNVSVEGRIRHECVDKDASNPPLGEREFGDAPEGALAYPSSGVLGLFPTCVGVGPAAWIEHDTNYLYFGPKVDVELDGNAGVCPAFNPDTYNQDEGQQDGDAGLIKPRAYTIAGSVGAEEIFPLIFSGLESLPNGCFTALWGTHIDIEVHNRWPLVKDAYVNLLIDWNQDGKWQGASRCTDGEVPEHVLVNFPVPNGYEGSLSALTPPNFKVGPLGGYVWTRFSITEKPVPEDWNGDGVFDDGETEDYLLHVKKPLVFCDWEEDDPHKMHWPQLPDLRSTGMDVDMYWTSLADDFRCGQSGPITDIHFWASFMDDIWPTWGVDSLKFEVNIYSDRPADNLIPWSRPGELLWTKEIAPYGYDVREVSSHIAAGWFDPASKSYEPDNHGRTYQYNICFDDEEEDLFVQKLGTTYWLEIKEVPRQDTSYVFGWKTTQQHLQWQDSAVWLHPTLDWMPMSYPENHPYERESLDLSFVITGPPPAALDFGDAPNRSYPTLHLSDGARHTIDPGVFLGRSIDPESDGQPDATSTGDDNDGNDDEDGVVFLSVPTPGSEATVEVTASTIGVLNAWLDFNSDGDWDDLGEQIFTDEYLSAGANTLTFNVPASAAPAQTFSRWRFSKMRGLDYTGPAPDGEVEDHLVRIEEISVPGKPPVEHLKWSQPPLEWLPGSNVPVYCGWDELAFTTRPSDYAWSTWTTVADDFRCVGSMPVTSVHWWGSYQGWRGDEIPRTQPASWRIGFWSNVPADGQHPFSRPGKLLWVVTATADRVEMERAGLDEFPGKPSDTCFQYLLGLDEQEHFWQGSYDTEDDIFWISITAVYTGYPEPDYIWGWKTRPQPWQNGAVTFEFRNNELRPGITVDPSIVEPVANSLMCERLDRYDMAFELDTDPDYIKWEQPFTGLRHWAHYEDEESLATTGSGPAAKWVQAPDLSTAGMAVDITMDIPPTWSEQIAGDDFQCTTSGPITGISIWGAWYHDLLPNNNIEDVTFTLSIREDIPANQSGTGYSMPGRVLWRKDFKPGEFTVQPQEAQAQSFYSPCNDAFERDNHLAMYKYGFQISAKEAFEQTGSTSQPKVYWLCAQAYLIHAPGSIATRFGWKASADNWNDNGVWVLAEEPYEGRDWGELRYPKGHPSAARSVDLAFEIETEKAGSGLTYRQLVADDWQCLDSTPITGLAWWGSYIGYTYQACECTQMASPTSPDYFLLSIWSDAPDPTPADPITFSYPAQKIWEYRTDDFDEVLVGFDKHPLPASSIAQSHEPVYRYTVRLPQEDWFCQRNARDVYWLSVVAVYEDPQAITYPWGWTNHPQDPWSPPERDLLAHWKLDESEGKTATDSSGNGNDGTLMGSPVWRPDAGYLAGAIDLDGRQDYIKVARPKGFDLAPNSFSVSVWVNARQTKGRWQAIMEYDRTSSNGNRFGLWIDNQGRFHFRVGLNTWQTTQSLMAGQWYNLVASYDSNTRQMRLYINSVLDATATNTGGFNTPVQAMLTIGVRGDETSEFFNGLLDDVQVFGGALEPEDILTLVGAGRNDDAVAGQWRTDGTAAGWQWTELYDQTGASEDMSFMLFTEPEPCESGKTLDVDESTDTDDDKKDPAETDDSKDKL